VAQQQETILSFILGRKYTRGNGDGGGGGDVSQNNNKITSLYFFWSPAFSEMVV